MRPAVSYVLLCVCWWAKLRRRPWKHVAWFGELCNQVSECYLAYCLMFCWDAPPSPPWKHWARRASQYSGDSADVPDNAFSTCSACSLCFNTFQHSLHNSDSRFINLSSISFYAKYDLTSMWNAMGATFVRQRRNRNIVFRNGLGASPPIHKMNWLKWYGTMQSDEWW